MDVRIKSIGIDFSLEEIKYCVVCKSNNFKQYHTPDKSIIKYHPVTGKRNELKHELTELMCIDCGTVYVKRDAKTTVLCQIIKE